jgi:hypothetical protein
MHYILELSESKCKPLTGCLKFIRFITYLAFRYSLIPSDSIATLLAKDTGEGDFFLKKNKLTEKSHNFTTQKLSSSKFINSHRINYERL